VAHALRVLEAIYAPPEESAPAPATDEEVRRLFVAIDENDLGTVRDLLAGGLDPDTAVPADAGEDLLTRFRRDFMLYYVTKDSGFTPLMFAAGRGHLEIVQLLLQHGATPNKGTKRHGTNALWLAGYAGRVPVIQRLMGVQPGSEADRTLIEIDLASQTARLVRADATETVVPISSGKKSKPTPTGEYVVTNKHRHWKSTIFGVSMPFYLRLSSRDFGLHAGHLPGYPASSGCIRLRRQDAETLFHEVPLGTRVVIR